MIIFSIFDHDFRFEVNVEIVTTSSSFLTNWATRSSRISMIRCATNVTHAVLGQFTNYSYTCFDISKVFISCASNI